MCEPLTGYILIHRKILYEWPHWHDAKTVQLFLYLILKANYEDTIDDGVLVKRGSLKTTLSEIHSGTKLTIQEIRSRLSTLTSTGEITDETTDKTTGKKMNKYRIITVVKYNDYQFPNKKNNKQKNKQNNNENNNQITNLPIILNNINKDIMASSYETTPPIEYSGWGDELE